MALLKSLRNFAQGCMTAIPTLQYFSQTNRTLTQLKIEVTNLKMDVGNAIADALKVHLRHHHHHLSLMIDEQDVVISPFRLNNLGTRAGSVIVEVLKVVSSARIASFMHLYRPTPHSPCSTSQAIALAPLPARGHCRRGHCQRASGGRDCHHDLPGTVCAVQLNASVSEYRSNNIGAQSGLIVESLKVLPRFQPSAVCAMVHRLLAAVSQQRVVAYLGVYPSTSRQIARSSI